MKRFIVLTTCLFAFGSSFAQKKGGVSNEQKLIASGRSIAAGFITDDRNKPITGVQAFIYQVDSSIIASGYTGEDGFFETNGVLPGKYNVKLVYPSSKSTMISDVTMKRGTTVLNIKGSAPAADTTVSYAEIAPKPVPKKSK